MKLQIMLTDDQLDYLWAQSALLGYKRINPKKTWTLTEKKYAIKWCINRILNEKMNG